MLNSRKNARRCATANVETGSRARGTTPSWRRAALVGMLGLSALTLAAPAAAQQRECPGGHTLEALAAWQPTNLVLTRDATDITNGTVTLSWNNPCSNIPVDVNMAATSLVLDVFSTLQPAITNDTPELFRARYTASTSAPPPAIMATVSSGTHFVLIPVPGMPARAENRPRPSLVPGTHQLWIRVSNGVISVSGMLRSDPVTICPTAVANCTPSIARAAHSGSGIVLEWDKPAGVTGGFDIYYGTAAGVTAESSVISSTVAQAGCTSDASCTHTIAYGGDFSPSGTYHFRIEAIGAEGTANPNAGANPEAKFGLSAEVALTPIPSFASDQLTLAFAQGSTSTLENRACVALPRIMGGDGAFSHSVTGLPDWLEHREDDGQQLCIKVDADPLTATTAPHLAVSYTVRESGGDAREATASITLQVNAPPPPESSSSSSGGAIALVAIAAGAYFWWKKRQIASGNVAKMALLPDVSFDLDRNDNRAFYTRMNWQNAHSNWQIRSNLQMHTKYSGKLLDWNANSHFGYRLSGKLGDFNPYMNAKFVQNDPGNAKMHETYTLGVNYAMPSRFAVQFLQPDDEIWRYSINTQVYLPRGISMNFTQPNSDIWRYSTQMNWQISERIGLQLTQPNNDLPNYGFGIQWHGDSKIRYGISGETVRNSYRFTGQFSF